MLLCKVEGSFEDGRVNVEIDANAICLRDYLIASVDEDALYPARIGASRNLPRHIAKLIEDGKPHSQAAFSATDEIGVAAASCKPVDDVVRQPAIIDHAYERRCHPSVRDVLGDIAGYAAVRLDNTASISARWDVIFERMPFHIDKCGAYDDDSHD